MARTNQSHVAPASLKARIAQREVKVAEEKPKGSCFACTTPTNNRCTRCLAYVCSECDAAGNLSRMLHAREDHLNAKFKGREPEEE